MRIGAAVVHYRFWPRVRDTLDPLLAQTRPPDHVVVVENGSGDGSDAAIRAAYPGVDVLAIEHNVGPIAGMNAGMDALLAKGCDAILLLTHETVLAPDALEAMAGRLAADERIGVVGPLLGFLSDRARVWSAGGEVHPRNWDTGHHAKPDRLADWLGGPPREVDWLDGACLLFRADAVRRAGHLNADFFAMFDEPDYQLRLRALGWRAECVAAAVAWQEPGAQPPYMFVRNRLGFIARHAPRRFVLRELARVWAYAARDLVRPRPDRPRADAVRRLKGTGAFLLRRWGPAESPQASEQPVRS